MPRYEYECERCGPFEITQKISDPPLSHHDCGALVERVVGATAFVLKGGGWYADGYGPKKTSDKSDKAAKADKPEKAA